MIERLGWTLVHFVWEGAAVAAPLALALLLLRRSSPALRYGLACAALFALAVLPVATFLILDPAARSDGAGLSDGATRAALGWTSGAAVLAGPSSAEGRLPLIVGIWAAGVAVLSLRLAGTLLQLERWRRRYARPAEAAWQARLDGLADRLGIARSVRLLVSDRLVVPSAWGVLRPLVVLPASLLTSLPPAQVESILLHELAHIRRHDYLVNLAQAVVETVLFYHPAVWWVSSVVRREREHCCDDAVVATLGDPLPYARALLHLEERRHVLPHPTLSANEGKLMNRIARILGGPPAPVRLSPLASPLASLLAGLGVVGLVSGGVLQAQAQETKRPASPATSRKTSAAKVRPSAKEAAKFLSKPTTKPPLAARAAPGKPPLAAVKAALARRQATGAKTAPSVPTLVLPKAAKATTVLPAEVGPSPTSARTAADPARAVAAVGATTPSAAQAPGDGLGGGFGGGGFGGASDPAKAFMDAMRVEKQDSGRVSVDLDHAPFDMALRKFAKQTGLSVVIERGAYLDMTMVLHDLPVERALTVLCRAAGANLRQEAGVWYVMPATSPLVVTGNTDRLVITSSPSSEPGKIAVSGAVPGP